MPRGESVPGFELEDRGRYFLEELGDVVMGAQRRSTMTYQGVPQGEFLIVMVPEGRVVFTRNDHWMMYFLGGDGPMQPTRSCVRYQAGGNRSYWVLLMTMVDHRKLL